MLYAIGDVHGCLDSLEALLKKLHPEPSDEIYFVGDVVHKGPQSAQVLRLIRENGFKLIMGNHERLMIDNFKEGRAQKELLMSYHGRESQMLDDIQYLETLPLYELLPLFDENEHQLIITHGYGHALLGKVSLHSLEFETRVLRERIQPNLTPSKAAKIRSRYFNIFGHVPLPMPLIAPCMAGIDTGCYNGNMLCAFSFPEKTVILQRALEHL